MKISKSYTFPLELIFYTLAVNKSCSKIIKLKEYFLSNEKKSVLFMSVSSAKFRKPVMPNEEVSFNVQFLNSVRSVYKFHGEAKKASVKVCEAVFSAMIISKESKEIF